MAGLEVPLLVEHAVVREKDFVIDRLELAIVQNRGCVEGGSVVVDEPDHGHDPFRRPRHNVELPQVVAHERALEDQVFRWVAGEDQLGKAHDVSILFARAADPVDDQTRIALEITYYWVDLRQRNSHRLPHALNFDLLA